MTTVPYSTFHISIPQDVDEGEEVTRNYVEGPSIDPLTLDALLLPWFPEDLTHVDPRQEEPPRDFFLVSVEGDDEE